MLLEEGVSDIVSWNENGIGFVIFNVYEFTEKVLPSYFKHSNFASFIRQLNIYGFSKARTENNAHLYIHPKFIKDQPNLLSKIRRKKPETALARQNFQEDTEIALVIKNVSSIQQSNSNCRKKIKNLQGKVDDLTDQNKLLTDRILETNERIQSIEQTLIYLSSYTTKKTDPESQKIISGFPFGLGENIENPLIIPEELNYTKFDCLSDIENQDLLMDS